MANNIKAFSSVSVRDYTDLGQIMMYLTSSQPMTVVYDPNQNTWLPNWSTSHLVITPVIQYNGSNLPLNSSGLTIVYKKKEGSANPSSLDTGENVSNGILTVSANKLATSSVGIITYICNVSYTDPEIGVPIETESSITYTLISQATELKSAYITGENLFLYDTNKTLVGSNTIVLTADLSNTSIQQWQYKKPDGTFAAFPTTHNSSISDTTLNVLATEPDIWLNGKSAIIKLVTNDVDIYDIHQITKVSDGAAGNATISVVLSNDSHYVPCDSNGNITSWNGASTVVTIYEGGEDVTNTWNISENLGTGLTGVYDNNTHTFTPSGLTNDTSYCDFVCTKTDYATITKRYVITKSKMGADGKSAVLYYLDTNVATINKSESGVYSPSSITFSSWMKVGDTLNSTAYQGRFVIEESSDGIAFRTLYTSSSNETMKTWSPSSTGVSIIRCTLYASGGTTNALDSQSIVITKDGISGTDGQNGTNGISMGLGNYQDILPCNSSGFTSQTKDISIPFYGLAGIQKIPVTATIGVLPTGISVKSNAPGTVSSNGLLIFTVANNSNLGSASLITGDITITLSCTYNSQTQSVDEKFTWTKNLKAINGTNSTILQIYSEDGGVIRNSNGSTTLKARLISGASEVIPTSIQWAKYESGVYNNISGATTGSLVVTHDMVDDLAFFKASAYYGSSSTPYVAYFTVDDITDPYMSYTFCTVPAFQNSQGFGAVYTRVYQNGIEIDPIKSTIFSDSPPSNPSNGDYYYYLDSKNKTCTLKKYNGTKWNDATSDDNDLLTYNYYRQNNKGDSIDTTAPYKSQRCIYVDPSIISGAMQFICEVS